MACGVCTTISLWRRSILLMLALTVPRLTLSAPLPAAVSSPQPAAMVFDDGDAQSQRRAREKAFGRWSAAYERVIRAYRDTSSAQSIFRGALLALFILIAGFQRARLLRQKKTVTGRADMWRIALRTASKPGTMRGLS